MLLNYFKDFLLQRMISKKILNVGSFDSKSPVNTVGVLFDEANSEEIKGFIEELKQKGIREENIKVLVFKNKIKKTDFFEYSSFCKDDLTWGGEIGNTMVLSFVNEKFDLLINYYDTQKASLLLVTNKSNANFKVGFSSVDKRLNHFMIDTTIENYKIFIDELFKYLKILNKI